MRSGLRFVALTAAAVSLGACSVEFDFSGERTGDKPAAAEPQNCPEAQAKLSAANEAVIKTGSVYLNASEPTRDAALRGHITAKVDHLAALAAVNTLCPH